MGHRLCREEFAVLAFLHENALAFDPSSAFEHQEIAKALVFDEKEVARAVSYLRELRFVGKAEPEIVTLASSLQPLVYLTGKGENFMRAVEERLEAKLNPPPAEGGRGGKVGVAVVAAVWKVGEAAIVKVLAEKMSGR